LDGDEVANARMVPDQGAPVDEYVLTDACMGRYQDPGTQEGPLTQGARFRDMRLGMDECGKRQAMGHDLRDILCTLWSRDPANSMVSISKPIEIIDPVNWQAHKKFNAARAFEILDKSLKTPARHLRYQVRHLDSQHSGS
jgi:hypothetical protein